MKATRELAYGILFQGNQVRFQKCYKSLYMQKPLILTCAFNLSHFFYAYTTTGRILDFSNADMAVDQYHRFKVKYIYSYICSLQIAFLD